MGTPTVSQAKNWTSQGMMAQAQQSHGHANALIAHAKQVEAAADSTRDHFDGKGGEATREHAAQVFQQSMQAAKALSAAGDAQSTGAAVIEGEHQAVVASIAAAEAEQFQVAEDGTVTPNPAQVANAMGVLGPQGAAAVAALQAKAQQYTAAIKAGLAGMGRADDEAGVAIERAYQMLPRNLAPSHVDSRGDEQAPAPPPKNGNAAQNKAWWMSLNQAQQRDMINSHPDKIGNRDGLPTDVRSAANEKRMPSERARLEKLRDELKAKTSGAGGSLRKEFGNDDAKLYYTEQKLKDLDKLQELSKDPNFKLMYMDMTGERGMAAYALGDPDTAKHIAVTTPGINTSISENGGFDEMVKESNLLKGTTEDALTMHGRGNESVATIGWLGYQPPMTHGPGTADLVRGGLDAASDTKAQEAAPKLASFYEGLDVANTGAHPDITALGHSYGSLATGLALQHTPHGVVNNMVVYGSPGLEASNAAQLHLDTGHAYAMRDSDDWVGRLNDSDYGHFGPDPGKSPYFQHLSTDAMTTPDGVHRDAAITHGDYPRAGSDGQTLRTSGYNMAMIIAGLQQWAAYR